MKEFYVTESELWSLGGLGIGATLFLSATTFFLGLWISIGATVDLTSGIKPEILSKWGTIANACGVAAIIFAALTLGAAWVFKNTMAKIIESTIHEGNN